VSGQSPYAYDAEFAETMSNIGSCVPARDIPRYVGLYKAGKLPVDKLMGERMPLADINRGFDRLDAGESLRDLIVFPD
jgi:alcohol dehydrogenase